MKILSLTKQLDEHYILVGEDPTGLNPPPRYHVYPESADCLGIVTVEVAPSLRSELFRLVNQEENQL